MYALMHLQHILPCMLYYIHQGIKPLTIMYAFTFMETKTDAQMIHYTLHRYNDAFYCVCVDVPSGYLYSYYTHHSYIDDRHHVWVDDHLNYLLNGKRQIISYKEAERVYKSNIEIWWIITASQLFSSLLRLHYTLYNQRVKDNLQFIFEEMS